ncbi:MAG: DUF4406 domain-containing protein [Candidatus Pacebacteria bacterium]|nr:DUF4406 domain-containing protein [Candidatus Paceibacterota bacterium]
MLYYLSGKITAPTRQEELDNMQVFFDTERQLVARGFEIFNPAKLEVEGMVWEWYLARDLKWINDYRPGLYMLPGWKESRGARLEYAFAQLLHLCIVEPM